MLKKGYIKIQANKMTDFNTSYLQEISLHACRNSGQVEEPEKRSVLIDDHFAHYKVISNMKGSRERTQDIETRNEIYVDVNSIVKQNCSRSR